MSSLAFRLFHLLGLLSCSRHLSFLEGLRVAKLVKSVLTLWILTVWRLEVPSADRLLQSNASAAGDRHGVLLGISTSRSRQRAGLLLRLLGDTIVGTSCHFTISG